MTSRSAADPSSVRQWNERLIVHALREHQPARTSQLGAVTGLTPASVRQVLASLAAKGWVEAEEDPRSGRGRPAQLHRLRTPQAWVLGLDIGAHAVRAVVVDLAGGQVRRAERRVATLSAGDAASDPRETAADLTTNRRRAVAESVDDALDGLEPSQVWATSLAIGGSLAPDGTVLTSVAIPEWDGRHPADVFEGLLPGRVLVSNDIFCATWAEFQTGAAAGTRELLLIHLGRRPTLGVLMGGELRHGAHGTAGDLSLNDLVPSEDDMGWLKPWAATGDPLAAVVAAARDHDPAAVADVSDFATSITPALGLAVAVLDPEVVVIGGAFAPVGHLVADVLSSHLRHHVQRPPRVIASSLDQFAAAQGAAHLALDHIDQQLLNGATGVAPLASSSLGEEPALPIR